MRTVTILLALTLATSLLAAEERDPIEGKWSGQAGFPTDRVDIAFEFKRNEKGELHGYLYQAVVNFYGLDFGAVTRDGDKYVMADVRLDATIKDGKLEGTYFPLNAPITMQRTEQLPAETPIPNHPPGPAPIWKVKLGSAVYAPAEVRDGVVYIGTSGGLFHAMNASDGAFVWTFVAGRGVHAQALATDTAVFFVSDSGYLYKLDRKSGKELWKYDLGDAREPRVLPHQVLPNSGDFDFVTTSPRPVLADGVLYVGAGDGGMHAVNPNDGARIWRFQAEGAIRADIGIDAEQLYVGTLGNQVHAVNRKSGLEMWKKNTFERVTSAPVLIDGKLIIGNRGGLIAAVEPDTGKTFWRMLLWGSAVESTPVPAGGSLFYIGSSDMRRVSLIDAKDSRVVWRTDVLGWSWPRPALSAKHVYVAVVGSEPYQMRHVGGLLALERESGKVVWRVPAAQSPSSWITGFLASPVIDGKRLFVGDVHGMLYAFPVE